MIFFYDPQFQALVYPSPPAGQQVAIPVARLKALGWHGEPADYARSLPPVGGAVVQPPSSAEDFERLQRQMRDLRDGGRVPPAKSKPRRR